MIRLLKFLLIVAGVLYTKPVVALERQIPAIDQAVPEVFETASFGMG